MNLHCGTTCAQSMRMNSKELGELGRTQGRRSRNRYGLALAAGLTSILTAGMSEAQTIAKDMTFVTRSLLDPERTAEDLRWQINRAECDAEDSTFTFHLLVTPSVFGQTVQVWGSTNGANCEDDTTRSDPAKGCVNLDQLNTSTANMQQSISTKLDVADLVGVQKYADGTGYDTDCGEGASTTGSIDLKIFFLLISSNQVVTSGTTPVSLTWSTKIDLWGPDAPTEVTITPGEGSVDITASGGTEPNITTVAYCAKDGAILDTGADEESSSCSCDGVGSDGSGGSAGTTNTGGSGGSAGGTSGMGGAGGAGGSTGGSAKCDTAPLVENALPDTAWTPCAEGTTIKDLENNATYAVGVAYRDQIGNVGRLSPIECATPSPIEDFFENYEKSGGTAGGGFCSISSMSPRTRRTASFATSFALGALALLIRRKVRPLRSASRKEVSK